jgi:hypothetical protein
VLLLLSVALAHPGSGSGGPGTPRSTVGQRVEIVVTDAAGKPGVDVRYVAEVPEQRVLEEARNSPAPGYGERLLESLADGVHLTWDGALLSATRVAIPDAAKAGETGFLDFAVAWHAELPGPTGTLGLRNGNFPDEPAFFATAVTLPGDYVAEETSLLKVKGGRVRDNWHGAWVRDEVAREPWVRIRPARWSERADGPEPLPLRMAGLDRGGVPLWLAMLALLSLVPIALLGRWLGRRVHRRSDR